MPAEERPPITHRERYLPIEDYAFLSDCHSTALVSKEGSIDWACPRRFDHGSVFGRLLDFDRGGYFSIRPSGDVEQVSRRYLPSTLVLETTMKTSSGTIRLLDAFAMRTGGAANPRAQLMRRIEGVEGDVEVVVDIVPRFEYGSVQPWLREHGDGSFSAVGGDDALAISTDIDLVLDRKNFSLSATTTVHEGESRTVTAVSQPAHLMDISEADSETVEDRLDETIQWWERWSRSTDVSGPFSEILSRSAAVLKGLCCAPTGAVVAAPTTSLPEVIGGSKNWDYRYCWIRDATLTLDALSEVGHTEVAQGFRDFVMRSSAGHGNELQVLFGPYGERRLTEVELDLEGWRESRPVRIGNRAAGQTQLDVYGHLLDAAHLWQRRDSGIDDDGIDPDEWRFLATVVEAAIRRREEPDQGVWELRGSPRHYVHSKVMVWVAIDRGIRIVEENGLEESGVDLAAWRQARDEIRHAVETRGVDPDRGNFVQHYGTTELDASLLKLPLVGFVDANDERMLTTVDAIREELGVEPTGFIRRYRSNDDEGVFLLCSFWLVEVLAMQGRVDEARDFFERLTSVGNDLGLFAEEYDVTRSELVGNFPQAYTHLGLIAAEKRLRDAMAAQ